MKTEPVRVTGLMVERMGQPIEPRIGLDIQLPEPISQMT